MSHWDREKLCSAFCAICLIGAAADARVALAQASQPAKVDNPLAARQQIVRDRMVQLEDRMYRLTEKLAKTDPEQARRLAKALHDSGELLIRHHMEEAISLLEQASLAEASEHQAAAGKALEQILTLLTESGDDSRERQEEIDRAAALREQVDRLLEQQRELRGQTDPAERWSEQIAAAAARLQGIIARQQKQIEGTHQAARAGSTTDDPSKSAALAETQAGIRQEAEALLNEWQKPSSTQPSDESAPTQTPLEHATEQARGHVDRALERMQSAEEDLRRNLPITSEPKQAKALESLQKALESLQKQQQALQTASPQEAAQRQRDLQQQAGKLADSMQEPGAEGKPPGQEGQQGDTPPGSQPSAAPKPDKSSPSPAGAPEGGQNGQQGQQNEDGSDQSPPTSQPSSPPSPGGKSVRQAQQHMKKAGDKLERQQQAPATRDQDRAIAELERAKAQLQDTLDQLRREQQEELLTGLEQRFRTMLLEQMKINAATDALDARKAEWARSDELNLAGQAEQQTLLSVEAGKALTILTQEGTTVVFPEIVLQVRDDMTDVARRLAARQTGEITRNVQAEIVRALQELIAAIEQRQKEGPPPDDAGQSQQAGDQQQDTPLLPSSAELKLLRSCQVRINRSTQHLDSAQTQPAAEIAGEAQRLSSRQEQLADMARKINERAAGQ